MNGQRDPHLTAGSLTQPFYVQYETGLTIITLLIYTYCILYGWSEFSVGKGV